MGCMNTRELSEEEVNLTNVEAHLGFKKSHAIRLVAVFHKYASHEKLSVPQFKDAAEVLGLNTKSRSDLTNVEDFYKLLRSPADNTYSLEDLQIISLLLGQGDASEKAKLLFEFGDVDATHVMNDHKFQETMMKVFKITIDTLPMLSLKPHTPTRESQYIDRIKPTKSKVIEELRKLVFKGKSSIEKGNFIEEFRTSEILGHLLTSHGFRSFCLKILKMYPSKWHLKSYLAPAKPAETAAKKEPVNIQPSQSGKDTVVVDETVVKHNSSPAVHSEAPNRKPEEERKAEAPLGTKPAEENKASASVAKPVEEQKATAPVAKQAEAPKAEKPTPATQQVEAKSGSQPSSSTTDAKADASDKPASKSPEA